MLKSDLVLLAAPGISTNIVHNGLCRRFGPVAVVMEQPVPRRTLLAGRIRRQGLVAVLSQIAFVALVRPLLERGSQAAVEAHCRDFALDRADIGAGAIISVPSVNSQQCRETLRALSPKLVVVNGTRIISRDTLAAPGAQFVNIHAGITSRYRDVHG